MASSSSSHSSPHPRPSNLLTIFQCHFHTRRGNELTFQAGHDLDLAGVEWKVLPSGAHSLSSDLIWFTLADNAEGHAHGYEKIGVACFRNTRLTPGTGEDDDGEEEGNVGLASHGGNVIQDQGVARLDQRGARMIAVGVIVASQSSLPSHQLAAFVSHLEPLSHLADLSSRQPRDHTILKSFLEAHRFSTASPTSSLPLLHPPGQLFLTRWPSSTCDPLLELPSIVNALGLIMPEILRALLVSGNRLLIFSPQGVETRSAASIAWVLAEMVEAALGSTEVDGGEEQYNDYPSVQQSRRDKHVPQVRGIIGLHELYHLQDEESRRKHSSSMSGVTPTRGWISWTTDKLYLDKADLYDCLLDLTPLAQGVSSASSGAGRFSSMLSVYDGASKVGGGAPLFYRVVRSDTSSASTPSQSKARQQSAKLQKQSWRSRDFTAYRDNEIRSVSHLSRPRRASRRNSGGPVAPDCTESTVKVVHSRNRNLGDFPSSQERGTLSRSSFGRRSKGQQVTRFFAILLDLLRYYLSTRAILSRPWGLHMHDRIKLSGESYGYVPLSIRPDGGVQAGLMLLPGDSDSGSDSGPEDSDAEGDFDADNATLGSTLRNGKLPSERETLSQRDVDRSPTGRKTMQTTKGLLSAATAAHPSSAISAARQRERNPFSDLENDDEEDEEDDEDCNFDSGNRIARKRSLSSSRSSGGVDIDPILAACGASPNGLSPGRRASRSSLSGSNTSGHSLNRRKRSSSRVGGARKGSFVVERETVTDQVTSASLTKSERSRATIPGSSPGRNEVDEALHSTDLRASSENESNLGASTSTLRLPKSMSTAGVPSQPQRVTAQHIPSALSREGASAAEGTIREGVEAMPSLGLGETCLARAVFASWAQWLNELVGALELLRSSEVSTNESQDPSTTTNMRNPPEPRHRSHSESSLLTQVDDSARAKVRVSDTGAISPEDLPPLTATDLHRTGTGLNARNASDRALVRQWTGREVRVESAWKFWAW